jgi:hypothetical protein
MQFGHEYGRKLEIDASLNQDDHSRSSRSTSLPSSILTYQFPSPPPREKQALSSIKGEGNRPILVVIICHCVESDLNHFPSTQSFSSHLGIL